MTWGIYEYSSDTDPYNIVTELNVVKIYPLFIYLCQYIWRTVMRQTLLLNYLG